MSLTEYKFAAQVGNAGKLEVTVPVPAGTPVEVVVLAPSNDDFDNAPQPSLVAWRDLQGESAEDIFAEMEPFTVRQAGVNDSREAIYQRQEGE